MTLVPGARLGIFEITAPLGAGGMGEVYRARDTKLGRDVAIKILPQQLLADPERRARFDREARMLAALNHPNVAAIYSVEEVEALEDGVRALVLELVEGPTLAERIRRGGSLDPPAIAEALTIAKQIADALEAAHDRGIVHRDLKPSNIKLDRPSPPGPEMRLEIATPPTMDPVSLAISPDARAIAFVATDEGPSRLWLRRLDSVSAQPLAGTDGAYYPFWSPDNRSLGFFADGKLKRIDLDTTSVQVLADASAGRGGTWNDEGVILFAPQAGPIFRISASGGERTQVTEIDQQRLSHRFPQFLPDGRHFLYFVRPSVGIPDVRGVYVGQIDGTETRRLLDADVAGVLGGADRLLFVRQGTLSAQPFDPDRLTVSGKPSPVAAQIVHNAAFGAAAISSSASGLFVYRTGPTERRQFTWFDRSGRELGTLGERDTSDPSDPALSPDGRVVALSREVDENRDIWLLDTSRGVLRRMTFDPAIDRSATWFPDGSRIVFTANRTGTGDLYLAPSGGGIDEKVLVSTPQAKQAADFSPDGRFLLFRTQDAKTRYDIWAVRIDPDRSSGRLELRDGQKPFVVVRTNSDERDPQFSPDGRWIAYESDESGRFEIYVQPFPGPGPKVPVSKGGGAQVRWPRNSHELFYIALDNRLMAVPIRADAERQTVTSGDPVPLFTTNVGGAVTVRRQQYVVSADGQRFLMNSIKDHASTSPITLVQNWRRPE